MPKVSICIAVYNVEKYIEQCVRSLFEQTLDDLEYVFVDDASPDSSIDIMLRILEEYPHRKEQVKLIRHENNQGVAAARKDAIAAATGDYIIHCDPDDWVELDMYEKMYNQAICNDLDMVYCNYYTENGVTVEKKEEPCLDKYENILQGFFYENCFTVLWNKLYRRNIVKENYIDCDSSLFVAEDVILNCYMLRTCRKVSLLKEYLYHYNYNINSLSRVLSYKKCISDIKSIKLLEEKITYLLQKQLLIRHKRRILLDCLKCEDFPIYEWPQIWRDEKKIMIFMKHPWKLKIIFIIALINARFARYIWRWVENK